MMTLAILGGVFIGVTGTLAAQYLLRMLRVVRSASEQAGET